MIKNEAIQLLEAIFRDIPDNQYIEYRSQTPGARNMHTSFFTLEAWRRDHGGPSKDGAANFYYGICPRVTQDGKKQSVKLASAIWFDECPKGLDAVPTLSWQIETSPGKMQGGYLLDTPTDDLAKVEELNIRLRQAVGGDNVQDVGRILRLPGYKNVKEDHKGEDGLYPTAEVRILNPDLRYSLRDLDLLLPLTSKPPSSKSVMPTNGAGMSNVSVSNGSRNTALTSILGQLRHGGMGESDLLARAVTINSRYDPPMDKEEVLRIVGNIMKYPAGNSNGSNSSGDSDSFDLTDLGNAKRFASRHGNKVRFLWAGEKSSPLTWDGVKWNSDGSIFRLLCHETAESIKPEAIKIQDPDRAKAVLKHAFQSQSKKGLDGMASEAAPRLKVAPEELDADPYILNCQNGILDLRTGELASHAPNKYCTKVAPVSYDPTAKAPQWEKFISEITKGDLELAQVMRVTLGYCLTGLAIEHKFWIAYGTGRNGKGVLLRTVAGIMGEYSKAVQQDFIDAHMRDQHPQALAELRGRRMVFVSETSNQGKLNDSRVKNLTGGDPITARFMHQGEFTFNPSHKLLLMTNYKPLLADLSPGMKSRVEMWPFLAGFAGIEDVNLETNLREEWSGILNWLVTGAMEYFAFGFPAAESVIRTTSNYLRDEDILGTWFEDCLEYAQDGDFVSNAELKMSFALWACNNAPDRLEEISQRNITQELSNKGLEATVKKVAGRATRGFKGLAICEVKIPSVFLD